MTRSEVGLRAWHEWSFWALMIFGGWLLLGSSGAALAVLCRMLPPRVGFETRWEEVLGAESLSFAHVSPYRVVLVARDVGRAVVYRDEVAPAAWARIRRVCLGNQ